MEPDWLAGQPASDRCVRRRHFRDDLRLTVDIYSERTNRR
jgi:hypothetical protein